MQKAIETKIPNTQVVESCNAPQALGPYSQAVIAGNLIFVSGQIAIDPETGKLIEDDITGQTQRVLKNIEAILTEAGISLEHVVKCEIFMQDLNDFQAMNAVYWDFFCYATKPARQTVQVVKLPLDALIEISCIAVLS
jgi:2-iminobutanoate/2-iminopropanoate deaminase